jgi:hypothetical protein
MRWTVRVCLGLGILATVAGAPLGAAARVAKLRLHKPRHGFQMRMESFVVAPSADREGCEHLVTPNREPMDVGAFQLKATPGTHHFVVWDYLGKDQNPADFWTGIAYSTACIGLGPQDGFATTANLFGMLTGFSRFQFPPGVAVRLEPHANVYANLHYHNYGATPVKTDAVFNFIPARKGTVQHHAQSFVVGTVQFDIPADGSASVTGEWHAPTDLNIVSVSTHQHRRGTDVLVHRIDAGGNDMGALVDSLDWEHPTVQWYEPQAMRLQAGEGFRFTCSWQNPDNHPVHFGVTSEDEMCFVAGYFYPDVDGTTVTGPGCSPQGSGLSCIVPGS